MCVQSCDWGEDGVLLFRPHARCVSCMAFSSACPVQLLSGSYDGSLRCMDVEKAVFDDVRDSPSTALKSTWTGLSSPLCPRFAGV